MPKGNQEMVAAASRTIFAQATTGEIATPWDHVRTMLAERFPKAAALTDSAKDEVLASSAFPRAHWRTPWSTNPLERLHKESKRRCRVVGIFPNDTAVLRLTGAIVLGTHEEWLATDRRYLSETAMAKRSPERENTEAVTGELDPAPAT